MAQHDYVISNGTGAAVRSDLNNALLAIVSQNSGATEPTTTYAYQWWADTTTGLLKIRNSANNAWITLRELDGTLTVEDGTVSAPGLAFRDDLNTGIWRPGTDQFAISTNGVERVEWGTSEVVFNDAGNNYDFRIEGDNNANLLFVDASADAVGIGTSDPGGDSASSAENLVIGSASSSLAGITINTGTGSFQGRINFGRGSTNQEYGYILCDHFNAKMQFGLDSSTKVTLDSSGRLGIGTSPADQGGSNNHLQVHSSSTSSYLTLTNSTTGTNAALVGFNVVQVGVDTYLLNRSNGQMLLLTNGTEAARIDTSQRFLVGTSTASGFASARMIINSAGTDTTGSANLVLQVGEGNSTISVNEQIGNITFGDESGYSYATISALADLAAGSDSPGRLVFSTTADGASSPTERMRIRNDGTIKSTGYGGASVWTHEIENGSLGENYVLRVVSLASRNDATSLLVQGIDSGVQRFAFRSNGGLANYSANDTNLCDEREKKNIEDLESTWNCLKHWELKKFHYNEEDDSAFKKYGVIAQQVEEHCPEVITEWVKQQAEPAKLDDEGNELEPAKEEIVRMGIKEQQMYWMAIKALQEAQVRIEALEAEVAALKAQ